MFDVGFLELMVIMVLGLLVLGPERLPKAAQKVGYWFGKARRYVEGMKSQVEAEFDTTEVKRLLQNQEVQIKELQNKITESGDAINNEFNSALHNDFDDDDPGSSHQEAAIQSKESVKRAEPQYDIIENGSDWDDEVNETAVKTTEVNQPTPSESVVSNKAQ